jgi:transposase-like protein
MIKVGSSEYVWLWVIIEPKDKEILSITISKDRNMLVAEKFLSKVVEKYGSHPVSTDGERTWYPPQACRFLKLQHHIHSPMEKSAIERTMQYIKDRIENFDDYFPCRKKNCKLKHVKELVETVCSFLQYGSNILTLQRLIIVINVYMFQSFVIFSIYLFLLKYYYIFLLISLF